MRSWKYVFMRVEIWAISSPPILRMSRTKLAFISFPVTGSWLVMSFWNLYPCFLFVTGLVI